MRILVIYLMWMIIACGSEDAGQVKSDGRPIPACNILLTDSATTIQMQAIAASKPFVVLYFSTSCPFSKEQITAILSNQGKFKDYSFYFITPESIRELRSFATQNKLSEYHNVIAGVDPTDVFGNYYKIRAFPFVAIYDQHRVLKKSFTGNTNIDEIYALMN